MTWQKAGQLFSFQTEAEDGERVVVCLPRPCISAGRGRVRSSRLVQGSRRLLLRLQALTLGLVVRGRGRAGRGCSILRECPGMGRSLWPRVRGRAMGRLQDPG